MRISDWSSDVCSSELINVLRPTVAVAWYVTFAALALHQYPECRQRIAAAQEGYLECFVQEVRRFYPFFPVVAARTRHEFEWKGYRLPGRTRVFLDFYGTDHDRSEEHTSELQSLMRI